MKEEIQPLYEDEIDLRAIFQTLWKARKAILIVTLAAVVIAFIISSWILPRQYQATAYVFIGQPVVEFNKSPSISGLTISPTLPDLKAVVKLSTAPGLLESVLKDPAVVAAIGNKIISISDMVTAVDVGKDQLSLQVTDTNPQRAAILANAWAEKVTEMVNATYGLGAIAQTLDSQVLQSQKDYEQSEAALEEALSKSRVDALSAQLLNEQADLKCGLDNASLTARVLEDLQFFEQGLNGISGGAPVTLGDGLALTTLRQRSLTSQPCQLEGQSPSSNVSIPNMPGFTVQIDSASFTGLTVSKALETTTQMRTGLEAQLTRLQSAKIRLEQEIPQLQKDQENAQYQLVQFTLKRDQSRALYADLLQAQQQVFTVLAQSSNMANKAVPPEEKSSPKVMLNTALAGMLGLMLSAFGILAMEWWQNEKRG